MIAGAERRLLQTVVAFACLIPIGMGAASLLRGASVLKGVGPTPPPDLDSHFRYLSGIFFAMGIAFASCIAGIERKKRRFRLLGSFAMVGGLGRLTSLVAVGQPSLGHLLGLAMELGAVPLLMLWQTRVARYYGA